MGVREEHLLKRIFDRQMDIHSGYLVYFDDVCMNEFVESYVTNVGISVGQSSASVTITYAPQFKSIDTMDEAEAYFDGEDGVQNGTSLRIFGENVFSRKYHILFDGIIKSRHFSRSPHGFSLVFTATDFMYWLSRSVIPIAIPAKHSIYPGERIRWKGQGIFVDDLSVVNAVSAGQLVGKTINEYWNEVLKRSLVDNSTVYSDENSVAVFDDAVNRVSILGDINPVLFSQQVIDLVITANALSDDTAYVALNNVTSKLLMEFFQDIDGVIKVKPPFWNEPVLKNYIIDPIMIKSGSEGTNWESFYTRVISQGGREEWEPGATEDESSMFTPIGVFVGEHKNKNGGQWADYLSYGGVENWNDGKGGDGEDGFVYVTGSQAEIAAKDYLSKKIPNKAVVCGIMANIYKESSFNPINKNGLAYGLLQWIDDEDPAIPSRFDSLYATAVNESRSGMNVSLGVTADAKLNEVEFQLEYFLMDIGYMSKSGFYVAPPRSQHTICNGTYEIVGDKLKECPDTVEGAKKAADIICRYYECPEEVDIKCQQRGGVAEEYYTAYSMKQASDSDGSPYWPLTDEYVQHYDVRYQGNTEIVPGSGITVNNIKCKCGCEGAHIPIHLVHIIKALYDDIKPGRFEVTSVYRCKSHNDSVGGSDGSLHRSGAAIDFWYAKSDKTPSYAHTLPDLYDHIIANKAKYSYLGQKINECAYYPPVEGKGEFMHIGIVKGNYDKWFTKNGREG